MDIGTYIKVSSIYVILLNITYRSGLQITRVPPGRYTFQVPHSPRDKGGAHANWQLQIQVLLQVCQ